jgi:hypothetical protein
MCMDCNDAREGLWPPERPKLVGQEVAAARSHVDECPECEEYFEQDRQLLDAYSKIREDKAPLEVREGVFDALSEARWGLLRTQHDGESQPVAVHGWARRATAPLLVVAGLVVIALGTLEPGISGADVAASDDPAVFVADYLRRAVGQDHIETSDPDEIVRFLQRELGMALRPLERDGLVLERAEICLLEGRRGAMIVYKQDGAAISHYLVPRVGTRSRAPSVSDARTGPGGAELPVVTWSSDEVEQALVGEVGADKLLRLAGAGTLRP